MHHAPLIQDLLRDAVLAGAREVLAVRRAGTVRAAFKDASELVTEADTRADAAMLAILRPRAQAIDPSISLRLEESGVSGTPGARWIGADPLDGTSHFAADGTLYSVQAHYVEHGVPLVGVVFQPEVYVPVAETDRPTGRLVWAARGQGAFVCRTEFHEGHFHLGDARQIARRPETGRRTVVACVPVTSKMKPAERALAQRVYDSGIVGASVGTGNAGGNVMLIVFGGCDVYANLGAGEELDLAPAQVVAEEIGLTVWGVDRRPPVWQVRKQPVVFAPNPETAETFLRAAGL